MNPDAIHEAVDRLRAGGLVAFPTDTGLVLGVDAADPEGPARLGARGGPLTLYLGPRTDFAEWVRWDARLRQLAHRFWPGPLVLVLQPTARVPAAVVIAGGVTVAVPSHPVAVALLDTFVDAVIGVTVTPGLPVGASLTLLAEGYPTHALPTVIDLVDDPVWRAEGAVPRWALEPLLRPPPLTGPEGVAPGGEPG